MEPLPERIDIELIRGLLPNYISARKNISGLKHKEAVSAAKEGREPRPVIYCQFCGRGGFQSIQALRGHLGRCPGKQRVRIASQDGITFQAGRGRFKVRTRSIKLISSLDRTEKYFGKELEEGTDAVMLRNMFLSLLQGAMFATPDGFVTFTDWEIDPATATAGRS